jgi:hypothetical protein
MNEDAIALAWFLVQNISHYYWLQGPLNVLP